ncbi:unnamed protein product [Ectocarpus sp. CCAP 1310/34]|nr:unnamed protein product [Ectocarpus sp. CCAP 1310/34]
MSLAPHETLGSRTVEAEPQLEEDEVKPSQQEEGHFFEAAAATRKGKPGPPSFVSPSEADGMAVDTVQDGMDNSSDDPTGKLSPRSPIPNAEKVPPRLADDEIESLPPTRLGDLTLPLLESYDPTRSPPVCLPPSASTGYTDEVDAVSPAGSATSPTSSRHKVHETLAFSDVGPEGAGAPRGKEGQHVAAISPPAHTLLHLPRGRPAPFFVDSYEEPANEIKA